MRFQFLAWGHCWLLARSPAVSCHFGFSNMTPYFMTAFCFKDSNRESLLARWSLTQSNVIMGATPIHLHLILLVTSKSQVPLHSTGGYYTKASTPGFRDPGEHFRVYLPHSRTQDESRDQLLCIRETLEHGLTQPQSYHTSSRQRGGNIW